MQFCISIPYICILIDNNSQASNEMIHLNSQQLNVEINKDVPKTLKLVTMAR